MFQGLIYRLVVGEGLYGPPIASVLLLPPTEMTRWSWSLHGPPLAIVLLRELHKGAAVVQLAERVGGDRSLKDASVPSRSAFAESFDVSAVLESPCRLLVLNQFLPANEVRPNCAQFSFDPPGPGFVKGDTGDRGQQINPVGRQA